MPELYTLVDLFFPQFARWNYPEEFADIDPEATLRTYHEKFLPITYSGTFWVSLNE